MNVQTTRPYKMKVLIAQASSLNTYAPYKELAQQYGLAVDFKPLIKTLPVSPATFRKYHPKIRQCTAIFFKSKIAIDHFFELSKTCNISSRLLERKSFYFINNPLCAYIHKYIAVGKRNLFSPYKGFPHFFTRIKKKKGKIIFPCSEAGGGDIVAVFKNEGLTCEEICIYKIVADDSTDLTGTPYDMIVFFSHLEVNAFITSFPDYELQHVKIATFGAKTFEAAKKAGLQVHIQAPQANAPSMVTALDLYFAQNT